MDLRGIPSVGITVPLERQTRGGGKRPGARRDLVEAPLFILLSSLDRLIQVNLSCMFPLHCTQTRVKHEHTHTHKIRKNKVPLKGPV